MKRLYMFVLVLLPSVLPVAAQTEGSGVQRDSLAALWEQMTDLKDRFERDSVKRAWNERQKAIWANSKPLLLGYENWDLTTPEGTKLESRLGVGLSMRRTFYLQKKAFGGMAKFGLDVNWFDLSFAHYAKGKGIKSFINGDGDEDDAWDDEYWDDDEDDGDDWDMDNLDIGKFQITTGLLGVGPSISLSPLVPLGNPKLDQLKVKFYFHYVPSFTLLLLTGDGSTDAYGGYLGRMRVGGIIGYKRWGIGVEHTWGKSKLKYFGDSDFAPDGKCKMGSTRFSLVFRL